MPRIEANEAEQIELELKKLHLDQMREELAARREKKERLTLDRERQMQDYKKGLQVAASRQSSCKHRKGGRDNRFARGTDANYSINVNTYPMGNMVVFCTRCGKEVPKPDPKLKKSNPKLYAEMWAEWTKWMDYPTDNSPSGSKIFEVVTDAAA